MIFVVTVKRIFFLYPDGNCAVYYIISVWILWANIVQVGIHSVITVTSDDDSDDDPATSESVNEHVISEHDDDIPIV